MAGPRNARGCDAEAAEHPARTYEIDSLVSFIRLRRPVFPSFLSDLIGRRSKCDDIEAQLASLQQLAGQTADSSTSSIPSSHQKLAAPSASQYIPLATENEVEEWFEGVSVGP